MLQQRLDRPGRAELLPARQDLLLLVADEVVENDSPADGHPVGRADVRVSDALCLQGLPLQRLPELLAGALQAD